MSNDISIVKNVLDKQQHKVSVSNDILLNQKQKKYIGIAKNQEKFSVMKTIILDLRLKVDYLESNSSSKEESKLEEKISLGDDHRNAI